MERDKEVTTQLETEGYIVLRFWGKRIKKELEAVVDEIERSILARREWPESHLTRGVEPFN